MPMKRSYAQASGRPRRYVRAQRKYKPRIPRGVRMQTLTTSRKFWSQVWLPSATSTNDFWRYYQFQPNQLPNWSDYNSLFDQYKVNALKFSFVPRWDGYDGSNTQDPTQPGVTNAFGTRCHVVVDPYSTVVPTGTYSSITCNSMMEQGNVKSYIGTKTIDVYFKPTINMSTEAGNNYRVRAPWLNVTSQNVHNGFHIFLHDSNFIGNFNQAYDVFITAYMSFRNIR